MKTSNWYRILICTKCEKRMSYDEKMYNDGICPRCGHDHDGVLKLKSTVCHTKNVILRETRLTPWWQIWNKKFSYEGKNEFSKKWLK